MGNEPADAANDALLTLADLHARGLPRSTAYAEMARGRLRAVKIGRRTKIRAADWKSYLDALPKAAAGDCG